MINSVKAFVVVMILALTTSYLFAQTPKVVVVPLGGYDGPVCCKIISGGILITSESHRLCNSDNAETKRVGTGFYEVDFLSPLTDVRPKVKMLTLDNQGDEDTLLAMGSVTDRIGDISTVFVSINNFQGGFVNEGFNLCLF